MEISDAGDSAPGRERGCLEKEKGAAFARVLGVRLGRFIEFEYFLDDGILSVELILPLAAFNEFCRAQKATVLPPSEQEKSLEFDRLAWRERQPGLLRPPARGKE